MVFELLQQMLSDELGCDEEEITLRSDLRCDLGLSDAELENVTDALSGELGFRYDSDDLESVQTVADLVRLIASLC